MGQTGVANLRRTRMTSSCLEVRLEEDQEIEFFSDGSEFVEG